MDIFVTGLLDYAKRWKNVEDTFNIGKRSLIVLMAEAWLRSIFDARAPIPYVWDAILKRRHPYIHSTTVVSDIMWPDLGKPFVSHFAQFFSRPS